MEKELISIFKELCRIPSPSMREQKVSEAIECIFKKNNIEYRQDNYGNIIGKVSATIDSARSPLLLSAHLDVVSDGSPVTIVYSEDGKFIETDKSTTLGADDKAGISAAIMLCLELTRNPIKHSGLEVVFTRDEEFNMSGIKNLEFNRLESRNILVLDADKLGQILNSGAGFTNLTIGVRSLFGGHSGIDIGDKKRLNAANIVAQIVARIGQGAVIKEDGKTVTSINLGTILAGSLDNGIKEYCSKYNKLMLNEDLINYIVDNSLVNIINQYGCAKYSIRSSVKDYEEDLIKNIYKIVEDFRKKYEGLIEINVKRETHLEIFEKDVNNTMVKLIEREAKKLDIENIQVGSFHAGAETHIYCNKKNIRGEFFKPILLGIANIYNMHSVEEKIDIDSFEKGYQLIKSIFYEYQKN